MSRVLGVIAHRVTFMGGAVGTVIMFIEILNRVLDYYKINFRQPIFLDIYSYLSDLPVNGSASWAILL